MIGSDSRRRVFGKWFYLSALNPFGVLPLLALLYGLLNGYPPALLVDISESLNLHGFIAYRTTGFEFAAAASAYWIALMICLLPNVGLMWWLASSYSMADVVSQRIVGGEYAATSKMRAYSLWGGYLRWVSAVLFLIVALLCMVFLNVEATKCKGCETGSILGFVFINWVGFQSVLCLLQIRVLMVLMWRSIYDRMEK